MFQSDDYWVVLRKDKLWGWKNDDSGPHVIYESKQEALEWARTLLLIHPKVRLRHVVTTYEDVTQENQS